MNELDKRLVELRKQRKEMSDEIKKRKDRINTMKFLEKALDKFVDGCKDGSVEKFLRGLR